MARPLSEKKNIDLDCEIEPALPLMRQDRSKVEQIINNLLSNAIKFTPDGGRIVVNVLRDRRGELRLSVTDTGVGISEEDQGVIFEKFRQGSNVLSSGTAMTREYSGTGLGLSIVRELCRLLGGEITVESELGKGSEFTVVLPWELSEVPRSVSELAEDLKQLSKPRLDGLAAPLGK
jgi:signal transduction histidine kinase